MICVVLQGLMSTIERVNFLSLICVRVVPALDSGSRRATTLFVKEGLVDVLVTQHKTVN